MNARAILLVAALAGAAPLAAQCEVDRLVHTSPQTNDGLAGFRAVDVDGGRIVAGTPGRDEFGTDAGAAWIFDRVGAGWATPKKLVPSVLASKDLAGAQVAVAGDVAIVAVGPQVFPLPLNGRVHVFERVSGVWTETALLTRSNGFGRAVALDGVTLVVGAWGEVVVYEKQAGFWTLKQVLKPSDPELGSDFGWDVDIEEPFLVVADPFHSHNAQTSGTAYVFQKVGTTWNEIWETHSLVPNGRQGDSVAIRNGTIAVGAPYSDEPGGATSGSVYVYEKSGPVFPFSARLLPTTPLSFQRFGWAVDVADDGKGVVVGALAGEAFVHSDDGTGWKEEQRLFSSLSSALDAFGSSVAISGDDIVVGAPNADDFGLDRGVLSVWARGGVPAVSFAGTPASISLSLGGTQTLGANDCVEFAGNFYYVLGNIGFTTPGIPFGGFVIPLNPGPYFLYTINNPNTPLLSNSFGTLDPYGDTTATLNVPAGTDPVLAGLKVNHAFGVLDSLSLMLVAVSNPVTATLVP